MYDRIVCQGEINYPVRDLCKRWTEIQPQSSRCSMLHWIFCKKLHSLTTRNRMYNSAMASTGGSRLIQNWHIYNIYLEWFFFRINYKSELTKQISIAEIEVQFLFDLNLPGILIVHIPINRHPLYLKWSRVFLSSNIGSAKCFSVCLSLCLSVCLSICLSKNVLDTLPCCFPATLGLEWDERPTDFVGMRFCVLLASFGNHRAPCKEVVGSGRTKCWNKAFTQLSLTMAQVFSCSQVTFWISEPLYHACCRDSPLFKHCRSGEAQTKRR